MPSTGADDIRFCSNFGFTQISIFIWRGGVGNSNSKSEPSRILLRDWVRVNQNLAHPRSLGQGDIFTGACLSTEGVCGRHTPRQTPPLIDTPGLTPPWQTLPPGRAPPPPPPKKETATEAGRTHTCILAPV